MLPEEKIRKLLSENEYLQDQLEEMSALALSYKNEIRVLQEKYSIEAELRSILENDSEEKVLLKYQLEKEKQKAIIVASRESSMELELLESIKIETEYYNIKDQQKSAQAQITDMNLQIKDALNVYKNLEEANRKISEISSINDILREENELLLYQLKNKKNSSIE